MNTREHLGQGAGSTFGNLTSGINRTKDVNLEIKEEMLPIDMSDDKITLLLELEQNFKDNRKLDYELFPEVTLNSYNSNSFVSGILGAADYKDLPTPDNIVPGYSRPVSGGYFSEKKVQSLLKSFIDFFTGKQKEGSEISC